MADFEPSSGLKPKSEQVARAAGVVVETDDGEVLDTRTEALAKRKEAAARTGREYLIEKGVLPPDEEGGDMDDEDEQAQESVGHVGHEAHGERNAAHMGETKRADHSSLSPDSVISAPTDVPSLLTLPQSSVLANVQAEVLVHRRTLASSLAAIAAIVAAMLVIR